MHQSPFHRLNTWPRYPFLFELASSAALGFYLKLDHTALARSYLLPSNLLVWHACNTSASTLKQYLLLDPSLSVADIYPKHPLPLLLFVLHLVACSFFQPHTLFLRQAIVVELWSFRFLSLFLIEIGSFRALILPTALPYLST